MDKLRHDGIYGHWVYRVLYQVYTEGGILVYAEDCYELFWETGGQAW